MILTDADTRRRELAKIHIAAKQLGMDPADKDPASEYRCMLWAIGRVHSAADLDHAGRQRVLDHLKACGFKAKARAPAKGFPGRPHNADQQPQILKIEALLADAGRPWSYADAMAARMFSKERVAFCNPDEWQRIIAALVIDQRRRKERSAAC
jgi:phage gp16-like protein